jgi:predicted DNA-binding protein with PD1-like motif/glutaredoxin
MRCLPIHLAPGSDVLRSLEQLARERQASGFVLSVVGNLSQAAFHCPGQAGPSLLRGELEIISLQGTLAPEGAHLHLSLSDGSCQVWGGHLEPGTLVLKGADLLVGLLEEAPQQQAAAAPAATAAPAASAAGAPPRLAIGVVEGCPWSARALRMLRSLEIPHQMVEPREGHSVPQVWIDGRLIGGYDALAELHASGDLEQLR